ncbi:MAG: ATPase domain-containing protein [Candidatus Altiarchaeota archaeon]
MEKLATGIPGLDDMLEGGFIRGRPYLVCGGPGAGKTIFGMQFLMEGVKQKERGLFIALEESSAQLTQDMAEFEWDLHGIKIIDTFQDPADGGWHLKADSVMAKPEFTLSNLVNIIQNKIDTYNPKRIVIDSLTSIRMLYESDIEARKEILGLMSFLSRGDITSILTSEVLSTEDTLMEEFLSAGVIKLLKIKHEGETVNAVNIEKIRGSSFDKHVRPMKITDKGIVVFPMESVFS